MKQIRLLKRSVNIIKETVPEENTAFDYIRCLALVLNLHGLAMLEAKQKFETSNDICYCEYYQ